MKLAIQFENETTSFTFNTTKLPSVSTPPETMAQFIRMFLAAVNVGRDIANERQATMPPAAPPPSTEPQQVYYARRGSEGSYEWLARNYVTPGGRVQLTGDTTSLLEDAHIFTTVTDALDFLREARTWPLQDDIAPDEQRWALFTRTATDADLTRLHW